MDENKVDIIDLIINVLQDHEKTFSGQLDRFEELLDVVKPELGGLNYTQAHSIVEAHAYVVNSLLGVVEDAKRCLIQEFVHGLNRRRLVPNSWVEGLIMRGTTKLEG